MIVLLFSVFILRAIRSYARECGGLPATTVADNSHFASEQIAGGKLVPCQQPGKIVKDFLRNLGKRVVRQWSLSTTLSRPGSQFFFGFVVLAL